MLAWTLLKILLKSTVICKQRISHETANQGYF